MSLFENADYEWRETYFVLLDQSDLPSAEEMRAALQQMGNRIEISNLRRRGKNEFESLTLISPGDFAAMDITCTVGEEVQEQLPELMEELRPNCETEEDQQKLKRVLQCSARMDVYHFEQKNIAASAGAGSEEMDFMDPGGLLMVLDRIGEICQGIVIDPQTSSFM